MPPYILLTILLGAAYGTLFHMWRGKNLRDLILYFLTGILGFLVGQELGILMGFNLFLIGPLHVVEASLISWGSLFLMQWLKVGG
jgi:hypothetical protein